MYNPVTRVYGEPHKRPEVQNATIEFMAPSEYMVRLYLLLVVLSLFYFQREGRKSLVIDDAFQLSRTVPASRSVSENCWEELQIVLHF